MIPTNRAGGRPHRTAPLLLVLLLLLSGTVLPPIAEPAQAAAGAPAGSQAQQYGRTIGAAGNSACAIDVDGRVWCWGMAMSASNNNRFGELGTGDTTEGGQYIPVAVQGLPDAVHAVQLTGGNRFACALGDDGRVRCWGGLPGDRSPSAYRTVLVPEVVGREGGGALTDIVQVEAGDFTACAVDVRGDVWCWGYQLGGLGVDANTAPYRPNAVQVAGVGGATAVTVGESFACALTGEGEVWCWGRATAGQLGRDTTSSNNVPAARVQGPGGGGVLGGVVAVSAGFRFACALQGDGAVDCWGDNTSGKLGDGTTTSSTTPVRATALDVPVAAISAGWNTLLAVTTDRRPRVVGAEVGLGVRPATVFAVDAYSGSNQSVCWIGTQTDGGEPEVSCLTTRIEGVTPVSVDPDGVPDADLTVVDSGGAPRGEGWDVVGDRLIILPSGDPDGTAIAIDAAALEAALAEGDLVIEAATVTGGPALELPAGRTLTLELSGDSTYTGPVTGGGALVKDGAGALVLPGELTFSGGTTIRDGQVRTGCDVLGTGPVDIGGTLVIDCPSDLTVANELTGPGDLVKEGAGRLGLTGENTYAGGTTIRAGVLEVMAPDGDPRIGDGPVTVEEGAALTLDHLAVLTNALVLAGTGVDGTGAVASRSPNPVLLSGAVVLTDDALVSADGALRFSGTVDGAHTLTVATAGGSVAFEGAVGGADPLASVTVRTTDPETRIPELAVTGGAFVVGGLRLEGVELARLDDPAVTVGVVAGVEIGEVRLTTTDAVEVGVVDGLGGIEADGPIRLQTLTGDLRLTQPLRSDHVGDPAILLHAGLDAEIGEVAGGDILVSDQGGVSAPMGVVRLYGGSHTGSVGTTDLAGVERVRTLVDETTADELLALSSPGVFALYRAPGPSVTIEVVVQPEGGPSGEGLAVQPVLRLLDPSGNVVVSDGGTTVSIEVVAGDGAILTEVSATAVDGIVTFEDVHLAGIAGVEYTLRFVADGLTSADAEVVQVTHGRAARLGVLVHPVAGQRGRVLPVQPVLEIQDAQGNRVLDDHTTVVTAELPEEPQGELSGTRSAVATAGVVTYTDLRLSGALRTEYSLEFRAEGLLPVTAGPLVLRRAPAPSPGPEPEPDPEPGPVASCAASRSTSPFADVAASNRHRDDIDCLRQRGIVHGHTDGSYRPVEGVRRQELASLLAQSLESSGYALPGGQHGFADVAPNTHEAAIAGLTAAGILRGRSDDRFDPLATVTRAQLASTLIRALDWAHQRSHVATTASPFTDVHGSPHAPAIHTAYELGLTNGRTADRYDPGAPVRREQLATFLVRVLGRLEGTG